MKRFLVSILAVVILLSAMTGTSLGAETETVKEVPDVKIVMDGSLTAYKRSFQMYSLQKVCYRM
jgi:hypothetical protein